MTLILLLLSAVVIFLLTASALVFVIGPVMVLQPRRRGAEYYRHHRLPILPSDVQLRYEDWTFEATNNSKLHGWFIPSSPPAKGVILYLHGVGDNKISGIHLAKVFHDHRFHVLMYDSRAHGASEGDYCTYGFYEKHDVSAAINAVVKLMKEKNLPMEKIGIFGTSMGAAIALQAASIEPRISVVVAEGCFTNLRTITVDYQKRLLRLPWHFLRNIAMKRSEAIAHFRHREVSPLNALHDVRVPVLFIHGKQDTFIKYTYSEQLFSAANEPKELFLVDNAKHSDVHAVGQQEYENKVVSFFERWMH